MKEYNIKTKLYEYGKEPKCVECNWNVCRIFWLESKKGHKLTGKICGECLGECLINWGAKIKC